MVEWAGEIAFIQITPTATEKLISMREIRAVAGEGLDGDRYFKKTGTYSKIPGEVARSHLSNSNPSRP